MQNHEGANVAPELLAAIKRTVAEAVQSALEAKPLNADDEPMAWAEDKLLTRAEAERFTRALGQRVARGTFEQYASKGDGPPIEYFGAKPLYRVRDLRDWLSKRTKRANSATEHRRLTAAEANA